MELIFLQKKMDENELIIEFMKISKCDYEDAVSCLEAWGYDLKKAIIDYNGKCQFISSNSKPILEIFFISVSDTSTQNYFQTKNNNSNSSECDDLFPRQLNQSSSGNQHSNLKSGKDSSYRPVDSFNVNRG